MDTPDLPEALLVAGKQYLKSLNRLGFNPEGLLWIYNLKEKQFQLQILWSGIDRYGPFAMTKLLFRAYNAMALPSTIDPFSVHVRSPKFGMGFQLMGIIRQSEQLKHLKGKQWEYLEKEEDETPIFRFLESWIFKLPTKPQSPTEVSRNWQRFNERVVALAA